MNRAIVIRGRFSGGVFVPDEPVPTIEGHAELFIFPQETTTDEVYSIFELFGKDPELRSGTSIDEQIRDERNSWENHDLR